MGRNQILGAKGEDLVALLLAGRGYQIIERNWRIKDGEIDLVAITDKNILVFVEVKTRTSTAFGHPLEAITREKAHRLQK
ncbi:MAG: YraN family protein, partial [Actinomycetes bacterium]